MAEFYESLSLETLAPVYILASSEALLLDRALDAVTNIAVPENLRGFNLDQFTAKGSTADQILTVAKTLPMMASKRLLILRGIESMAAAELAKLVDYLGAPNPSTVFVGVCAKVDSRLKFFKQAKKLGMIYSLAAPKRLGPWIRNEAAARQVNISNAAADRLGQVVGSDLARLGLGLEQLRLYANGRCIEVDDVDDLIADTRERSVFELTDAIASGNQPRALKAVAGLFEQRQSSIGVVMMLARHMRQLGLFQAGRSQRLGQKELAKRVGVPPFALEKIARQADKYSVRALANSMIALADADCALKGFGRSSKVLGKVLSERIIVESLVRKLISLGA